MGVEASRPSDSAASRLYALRSLLTENLTIALKAFICIFAMANDAEYETP
jgi:hypothetical protein